MMDLQRSGIDMPQVAQQLLDEGIQKFVESLSTILQTITARAVLPR